MSALSFSLLGRPFTAAGLPPSLARWVERVWRFPHADAPASPFALHLSAGAAPPPPSEGAPCESRVHGGRVRWTAAGGEWWAEEDGAGVWLRLDGGGARLRVWGVGGGAVPAPVTAALFVAMAEAVRASGLLPLHAAVVARGGEATALAAPSGTGKSTTLLHAVRAGWTPLAEDFAWLDPATLRVYGWDRGVHLWPAGLDAAGVHPGGALHRTPDGKLFFPFAAAAGSARLRRVALLTRDASLPSAWHPVPPAGAVRALWECTGVPLWAPSLQRTARAVERLLPALEWSRLHLGSTPLPLCPREAGA